MHTTGKHLNEIRAKAGVSLAKVAQRGGWASASSVQRYFDDAYDKPLLPSVAQGLARSLGDEVYSISGGIPVAFTPAQIPDVIALLRNESIPADVRCAAAAEKLSRIAA